MFNYTELEKEKVICGYFKTVTPPSLNLFPSKQKKQYIVLKIISQVFEEKRVYTEKELNQILKEIYHDFVTIRRGLVDYQIMSREKDCSKYWLK